MTLIKSFIAILVVLFINTSVVFGEEKIVYLNLDKIVTNTNAGKAIISNLEKSKKKALSKFEKKGKELKKIESDINKQKNILSEDELKNKLVKFRKEITTYQNERQKVINDFNKKKIEEFNNFFKKITPIIENYVSGENIDIVLDKKNVFMAKSQIDITEDILDLINKKIK